MIYQTIYETLALSEEQVQAIIGAGDVQSVRNRRVRVEKFLESNEWDEQAFLLWFRQQSVEPKQQLPPLAKELSGAARAAVDWAATGFKFVPEKEQRARWSICMACDRLTENKRCTQCGCFMEIKSKLAGMKCPLGKW